MPSEKSKLDSWFGVIERSGEQRRERVRVLNESLAEPDLFVPDDSENPDGAGTGYWRVGNGVVSFRRGGEACPYTPESQGEYTDEFINNLHGLLEREPRN